jgi:hypothetical protein
VLSQIYGNEEKPVMYASCTLSPAKVKYCQLEKEALAIIFGIKRFHRYLYGRKFMLESDHQSLGPEKLISPLAAARIQRWSMLFSAYVYSITYQNSKDLVLPDYLSRHPAPVKSNIVEIIATFAEIAEVPVCHQKIAKELVKDPVLQRILACIQQDWPVQESKEELKQFFKERMTRVQKKDVSSEDVDS